MKQEERFSEQFEGLTIQCYDIEGYRLNDALINPHFNTPFVQVGHLMTTHLSLPNKREMNGNVYVIFKNQHPSSNMHLWVGAVLRVFGEARNDADIFCRTVQWIFKWAEKHIEEKGIKDIDNSPFIMPLFTYSEGSFATAFPY